jgi:hypothetical protein
MALVYEALGRTSEAFQTWTEAYRALIQAWADARGRAPSFRLQPSIDLPRLLELVVDMVLLRR